MISHANNRDKCCVIIPGPCPFAGLILFTITQGHFRPFGTFCADGSSVLPVDHRIQKGKTIIFFLYGIPGVAEVHFRLIYKENNDEANWLIWINPRNYAFSPINKAFSIYKYLHQLVYYHSYWNYMPTANNKHIKYSLEISTAYNTIHFTVQVNSVHPSCEFTVYLTVQLYKYTIFGRSEFLKKLYR